MAEPRRSSARLDSWKQIAEYLGRDVRTAMRWAKQHGLPVRRVAGGKGRSVYAFTDEVEAWLAGHREDAATGGPRLPASGASTIAPLSTPAAAPAAIVTVPYPAAPLRRLGASRTPAITVGVAALLFGGLMVARSGERPAEPMPTVITRPDSVSIVGSDKKVRSVFTPEPSVATPIIQHLSEPAVDLDDDREPDILAGISYLIRQRVPASGELLDLKSDGGVRWRFAPDDTVRFAGQTFGSPWSLADWLVSPGPGPRQVAVAAHHYTWWPSLVSLLDQHGRRVGAFVNSGWVESIRWLDNDHLAIAGFNNAKNAGMFAVLDRHHFDGHSPDTGDRAYVCDDCPAGDPLIYVTFRRSELNLLTASQFNRASLDVMADRILIATDEISPEMPGGANVIYEFDRTFQYLGAHYGGRYWDVHRRLELDHHLNHSRDTCPYRDGPKSVDVWDRARGWHPSSIPNPIPNP